VIFLQKPEKHQIRIKTSFFLHLAFLLTAFALLLNPFCIPANAAYKDGGEPMNDAVRYVYPMGKTVGIKLFSEGVLVIGLSDIKTNSGNSSPAKACGLQEGDIITHINSEEVNTIEEVQSVLQELAGEQMSMRILRDNTQSQVTAQAVKCSSDGAYKLGAWIRDSMAGIGTMTFYDPESKIFGTLGHGINDIDTAMLMPLQSGSIMPSSVSDVKKGLSGQPGELHGTFRVEENLGELYANTQGGVFGILSDESLAKNHQLVPVANGSEVKVGKATILCNIAGDQVEEYEVEIIKLFPNAQDTRNLMLHVTDSRLLNTTGGIVQGMSGSPIMQNGKLVGAVTHVLLNDPTRGYGIFADQMLNLAETAQTGLG
jgi:stage IV sporulation protein B